MPFNFFHVLNKFQFPFHHLDLLFLRLIINNSFPFYQIHLKIILSIIFFSQLHILITFVILFMSLYITHNSYLLFIYCVSFYTYTLLISFLSLFNLIFFLLWFVIC
ncbi:uncharacterized protein ASCRUDRAFT_135246 [Ascoidea rubescens DSM 1968]|uniref:TLC domain-containing protein n=1 Tax=Ascoidea rubescens DSM 1968 TaxID=1344418 RepID=A0A1D2VLI4_9ASCO|nr:hypothetical protein ASCRUDRAFT_135246 [Ascoidea rubescens DSM 1968]ODV62461.1 hypothetical protein ASCRUDRAFT_135246 [Ascoidea rubescens DSM 1968]